MDELTFVTTKRGGRNAVYRGYIYNKKNANTVTVYWSCTRRDIDGCRGAMKTLINLTDPVVRKKYKWSIYV